MLCLGIIGNFSGHLSGAEQVEEQALPNGIFVIDCKEERTVTSGETLAYPRAGDSVDIEPEFVLRCQVEYKDGKVNSLMTTHISIGNDVTIRNLPESEKISQRKSWGRHSKGINRHWWNVSRLSPANYDESIKLISYIEREGLFHLATPAVSCTELKVFYCHLMAWMVGRINNQKDEGMYEEILPKLAELGYPKEMILYTGAPNYTKWGEDNFLQKGDQVHIAAYNAKLIDEPLIEDMFQRRALINADAILSFSQTVA
ncbi:DUF5718 family protein [Vibrio atypicus]|uniref:DUF5718 family protein n=1 Tax=Vibrio atypicus TaxID=558271 RepID=UPI001356C76F|nr:DUF5718 family protein [Vibrio atypicus]